MANLEKFETELHENITLLHLTTIIGGQTGQPHDICIVSERGRLTSPGSGKRRARSSKVHPPKDPALHKTFEKPPIGLDRQIEPRIITDVPCDREAALAF